jgi:hypothetical protein
MNIWYYYIDIPYNGSIYLEYNHDKNIDNDNLLESN